MLERCQVLPTLGLVFGVALVSLGQSLFATPFGETQTPSCRIALLVIDVQIAVLGPHPMTADGVLVQEKVSGIASTARASGIPVVFLKGVGSRGEYPEWQLQFAPPLAVLDGDRLVETPRPDSFAGTALAELLRSMGVTTLLVTGVLSTGCVSATVAGALENGFDVIIVADGHSEGDWGTVARNQNRIWEESGLPVLASTAIDFAALCAPPAPAAGG